MKGHLMKMEESHTKEATILIAERKKKGFFRKYT